MNLSLLLASSAIGLGLIGAAAIAATPLSGSATARTKVYVQELPFTLEQQARMSTQIAHVKVVEVQVNGSSTTMPHVLYRLDVQQAVFEDAPEFSSICIGGVPGQIEFPGAPRFEVGDQLVLLGGWIEKLESYIPVTLGSSAFGVTTDANGVPVVDLGNGRTEHVAEFLELLAVYANTLPDNQ